MGSTDLVLVRGLPGSGKTTIARELVEQGFAHYEADQYFERGENNSYVFNPKELSLAHSWCLDQTTHSLANGRSCVVANTFSQNWEMRPYARAAARYRARLSIVEAVGVWGSIHGVPDAAIQRMRERWEPADFEYLGAALYQVSDMEELRRFTIYEFFGHQADEEHERGNF